YVSGTLVNEGPEERVTQLLAHHLIDTLGYERRQIRTRPQWRIPKSPGTRRSAGYPVDLVVFKDLESYEDPAGIFMIFESDNGFFGSSSSM
ncbi:MAG: type I restriction enzyme HsdR N-terminal domain-containing protein, partial [Acidobacteria bacterium]|nr:type I restriction enzyme HsdR N-terminal domain-containing protein [Acidobacteriota bacterium]